MIRMVDFTFDPTRADFAAHAHDVYRRLRDDFPLYAHPSGEFYALSRFADVRAAALDWRRYSSEGKSEALFFKPTLNGTDPPRATRLRALVSGAFTGERVQALEHDIRVLARDLIGQLPAAGTCDMITEFAALLPSMVMGRLIGLPPDRWSECREITDDIMRVRTVQDYKEPANRCYELFAELVALRRSDPRHDLLSSLLAAEIDGERLSDDELLAFGFALLIGGNDTTTNLIGNGLELVARHPNARRQLRANPELIPGAVEEMLRAASPTHTSPRTATCDIDLHGGTIPAGSRVLLVWASANLDDREFKDPERFDIFRKHQRHLAFGFGVHLCIGAVLARLEARIAFEELLPYLGDFEIAAEPHRVLSSLFSGFDQLLVSRETVTAPPR
jgi:cytochrome P450 family 130